MTVELTTKILDSASARLDLPQQKRPHWFRLEKGLFLGYRKSKRGAGSWSVRDANGKLAYLGLADDHTDANGGDVLNFKQAKAAAHLVVRPDTNTSEACTLEQALTVEYKNDLFVRGKSQAAPITLCRKLKSIAPELLGRDVNLITEKQWRDLRTAFIIKKSKVNWNRASKALCAALALVASSRKSVWQKALATVSDDRPEHERIDNVVLTEEQVRSWIGAAYTHSHGFGLLLEVLATTGARASQVTRIQVRDVDPGKLVLWVPKSGKGGGKEQHERKLVRYRVLISPGLAQRLVEAGKGLKPTDLLLRRDNGQPWHRQNQTFRAYGLYREHVARTLAAINLTKANDGQDVTAYALRHTNITRQLLKGIPVRVVAVAHDTSVGEIEKHYSKFILDHADDLIRQVLIDYGTAVVVKLAA